MNLLDQKLTEENSQLWLANVLVLVVVVVLGTVAVARVLNMF
ncbi:MAG: hypothetical protein NTX82_05675 [Candidatus Parcubacteria bacterium]|nr:hypothetical protein [Candidatus Parcubacteria bacterium]